MPSFSHPWPDFAPRSADFSLTVNGQPVFVHETQAAAFAVVSWENEAVVRVRTPQPITSAVVRPLRWNHVTIEDSSLTFTLPSPRKVSIEIEGFQPLFLFAAPPETLRVDRNDPAVRYFAAGKIHHAGDIVLKSGETLYLEEGAIVHGKIRALDAEGVRVLGRGILDGGSGTSTTRARRMAVFEGCTDLLVEGITMIHPESWMLSLGACDRVAVRDLREIGEVMSSDGIDVAGSRDVLIEDCFLRNNDDCIVVKALNPVSSTHDEKRDWSRDVRNVLARGCVLLNAECGNALEIGFETRADTIRDITFRDCDIIAAHGEGGVFTIHAGDRAAISDVTYENIRVEHFYDKCVDIRILHSRYSKDDVRGQIRNITFRNIHTNADKFNTVSLIGGFDAEHTVENVVFENFVRGDQKIAHPDQLHLFVKNASGVVFC